MILSKLFFYAGMKKYFGNTRLLELWMDYCYLESSRLSDNGKVNCCIRFVFLMNPNEFIRFMNSLFEGSDHYVIDNTERTYRF